MPWDTTLKHPEGLPLGRPSEVQRLIGQFFAGTHFYREPSGREKLAALPPGLRMPDLARQHLEGAPARLQGDYTSDAWSVRFHVADEGVELIHQVAVEARGNSREAVPLIEALTLATKWVLVDDWGRILVADGRALPEVR